MADGTLGADVEVGGTWYGPDSDLPDEVAEQINNPKAWADYGSTGSSPAPAGKVGTDSGARLARSVDIGGTMYGPDSYVPTDVAARITNPKAWEGGKLPDLGGPRVTSTPPATSTVEPSPVEPDSDASTAGDSDPAAGGDAGRTAKRSTTPGKK